MLESTVYPIMMYHLIMGSSLECSVYSVGVIVVFTCILLGYTVNHTCSTFIYKATFIL